MYFRGLIPQNFAELAEAVPIGLKGGRLKNFKMAVVVAILYIRTEQFKQFWLTISPDAAHQVSAQSDV